MPSSKPSQGSSGLSLRAQPALLPWSLNWTKAAPRRTGACGNEGRQTPAAQLPKRGRRPEPLGVSEPPAGSLHQWPAGERKSQPILIRAKSQGTTFDNLSGRQAGRRAPWHSPPRSRPLSRDPRGRGSLPPPSAQRDWLCHAHKARGPLGAPRIRAAGGGAQILPHHFTLSQPHASPARGGGGREPPPHGCGHRALRVPLHQDIQPLLS